VDRAEDSVCHGMHWVGQVGCAEDGVVHNGDRGGDHGGGGNHWGGNGRGSNNSVVAKTNSVVTKTSKDDLSISISLPLLVVVSMVMVVVQGRGTGDWVVGGVDTRGALVAQGESVGESVEAVSVVGLGTPLPAAGHCGTKVVGAETNVAGVDEASRGGGNSVSEGSRVSEESRGSNNSGVVAKSVANRPKTSNDHLSVSLSFPLPAAGNCSSKVVGAESNMAGVDEASRGGGNSVDGVGQSSVSKDSRGGNNSGMVAKTVANRAKTSNNHLSVSLSFPLPAAGHCSSKVVGAESNVAGVDEASRGGGNSVDWVGQSSVSEDGRGNSGNSGVVAKTVAKTSKDDLRVSLSLPLSILGSIGESSVGQGGTSAGHGQVQSVDTRGRLASEGVHAVSIGEGEGGVDHVGRGDGRKRGKSNKELHDGVW